MNTSEMSFSENVEYFSLSKPLERIKLFKVLLEHQLFKLQDTSEVCVHEDYFSVYAWEYNEKMKRLIEENTINTYQKLKFNLKTSYSWHFLLFLQIFWLKLYIYLTPLESAWFLTWKNWKVMNKNFCLLVKFCFSMSHLHCCWDYQQTENGVCHMQLY